MQMKGLEIKSDIRLTQPNDALDIELDQLQTNTGTIQSEFYATLFFDMLNGSLTGAPGGASTPGMKIKLFDVSNVVVAETPVASLDWYETEANYVSEVDMTLTNTLAADTYIASSEVILVLNDSGADKEVVVYKSTGFSASSFASADTNGDKGVLVSISNGDLTTRGKLSFIINK